MKSSFFASLLPELATRASRATLGRLGFSNAALRAHLADTFAGKIGSPGSYIGEPVFEATFGWEQADQSMAQLSTGLLSRATVDAMDQPPGGKDSAYRFPRDASPYRHQLQAWTILSQPEARSVVVTSGTGSGKTECFMVPILDSLVREQERSRQKLVGVRALFLYPLNALIESQQERLHAWTAAFDSNIRFSLYNGNTPDTEPQHRRNQTPNQVIDREVLRASPPPMLVTNATMLEYMLVRAQDSNILNASQGKLRWIVLDEAHTYIGSQAAELALLLRRVLHAFGVRARDVRFVATSATIGGDDAARQLQEFLSRLAGLPSDCVHVVSGKRMIPELASGDSDFQDAGLEQLEELTVSRAENRFAALRGNRTARRLRQLFVRDDTRVRQLRDITAELFGTDWQSVPDAERIALRWLDVVTTPNTSGGHPAAPFLPLRLHVFHNVLAGLWACADPSCSCKVGTALDSADWPFGMLYMEERRHCECGAPVFELRSCSDCNTTYLWTERTVDRKTGIYRLAHSSAEAEDEFRLDVEIADEDQLAEHFASTGAPVLIANAHLNGTSPILLDKCTLELDPPDVGHTLELRVCEEVRINDSGQTALACPECGGHTKEGREFFRRAILGAPFLLGEIVPTLLEFCPDLADKDVTPLERPYRGRRMITFTDSRQGTARMAAKLQQESERNAVRSLIYRRMLQAGQQSGGAMAERLSVEIEQLAAAKGIPAIDELIKAKNAELAALSAPQAVPWQMITSWLATNEADVRDWIHDHYVKLDPLLFKSTTGGETLAGILTMREFARRPRRLNSPETMGLIAVRYPKLDQIRIAPPVECGLTLQEWRDFLKISLDFWVRENSFIDLPEDSWRKWGGNRISRKWLLAPLSTEVQNSRYKRWPQCNPGGIQPRLVRLLSYVLKLDPDDSSGRDLIDSLLRHAWETLISVDLLTGSSQGRFLRLEDIALAPLTKGWLCPVTRRVLDVTLRGVTPYLPRKDLSPKFALCKPLDIPLCSSALEDYPSEEERMQSVRRWLNENEAVQSLRAEGVWSDLNDRIVEGSRFFRTAEHSAQQPGQRLREYERDFKSGRINLLSCSTTMEMGVDIGGISVVAMNNVPPHPANYLQRAGRAGRRQESRSVALTVCKSNPHDQGVLRNTLWPFTTRLPAPSVMLSSALIVQRHITSMLLAQFLKREIAGQGSAEKLYLAWWMLPKNAAPVDRFCAWATCFNSSEENYASEGIRSLLKHTCHEGITELQGLTRQAAAMVRKHQMSWFAEYEVIQQQLSSFPPIKQKSPAFKALSMQSGRLTGEYLLRELAASGVLPGYSFPTDIVSLDTLTCDGIEREKERKKNDSRDDNAFQRRELPSRDIVVALREYAPGAEVVIDGLVYRSSGVTLNWHAPASLQAASEIQNLRRAWRCKQCGSSGTSVVAENLSHCPDCGELLAATEQTLFDYLDPAGFAVDLYSTPHNDVSQQTYVPVQRPWIDARGDWRPLSNPARGGFRVSDEGTVFNYSDGGSGNGYAVCLHCGRAEPMPSNGTLLPEVFQDHKTGKTREHRRLRGSEGGETGICSGSHSSFAIKPSLRLGHESATDVLEVLLHGLDGSPLKDVTVAYSIAVAMRSAIAGLLGIEIDELGCETKPVQLDDNATGQAMVIYDHSASGYTSSVADKLGEIIRRAHESLNCEAGCQDACQHCLLQFDTRHRIDNLNRHAALDFLGHGWMETLELPLELAYFGRRESQAEWQSLPEAITRTMAQAGAQRLRIYLNEAGGEWDLAASPVRQYVRRWMDTPVDIIVPENALRDLEPVDHMALATIIALDGVSLHVCADAFNTPAGGATMLAEVVFANRTSVIWATANPRHGIPDMQWGNGDGNLLVVGRVSGHQPAITSSQLPQLRIDGSAIARIDVTHEFDGNVQGFGTRFVSALLEAAKVDLISGGTTITEITYHDRYLKNPLSCALFVEVISALKQAYADQWTLESLEVITLQIDDARPASRRPSNVWDDWERSEELSGAIRSAFAYCGIEARVTCVSKQDSLHARILIVRLSNGKALRITLDQGFSCWRASRVVSQRYHRYHFEFGSASDRQGELIATIALTIEGPDQGSYVFIEKTDHGTQL